MPIGEDTLTGAHQTRDDVLAEVVRRVRRIVVFVRAVKHLPAEHVNVIEASVLVGGSNYLERQHALVAIGGQNTRSAVHLRWMHQSRRW